MIKKSTLRYIILGLLYKQESTGYDIKNAFKNEIGEFWKAQHSHIYPELVKMDEDGLVGHKVVVSGTKLNKKMYYITDLGREFLFEWIESPTQELPTNKDEFILKLYFVESKDDTRINKMLKEQISMHIEKLLHLKSRMEILFDTEDKKQSKYGHYLILEYAIFREENYLKWLQEKEKEISEM